MRSRNITDKINLMYGNGFFEHRIKIIWLKLKECYFIIYC